MQGPRSKCDQVIFEFISKTTEIIVRSRCQVSGPQSTEEAGSNARFNFAICPVEKVRTSLQPWKHSLHVPLRVDIFYSHYPFEKKNQERILLERWCIDYVSNHEFDEQHQNNSATTSDNTDMISQLRQLCKKIMIALRIIYCKARILPAYQLHCYLTQGIPLGIQRSQERGRLLQQLQQHPGQPSIGYTFYAASNHHDDAADSYLQRNQFQQDAFRAIPSPYGTLQMSVWYHPQSNNIVLRQINSLSALSPKTRPIQIPRHSNHKLGEDFHHIPTSTPSSIDSGVHDFLIPNYSPKPESLIIKHQNLQYQYRQQHQKFDAVVKKPQIQSESNTRAPSSEQVANMKTSMSGLSLALLQNTLEPRSTCSPSTAKDNPWQKENDDENLTLDSPSNTQSPLSSRMKVIVGDDVFHVSEPTTAPASTNNRRSHSLSCPVSQRPCDKELSSSRASFAGLSTSPCSSYQPQTKNLRAQHPSHIQAKSLSPRSYLQNHLTIPTQCSSGPQYSAVFADANNLNAVAYGYGYNNPSPPSAPSSAAIPINKGTQIRINDNNETARSGITPLPSTSPRYLSSSPAPFLLATSVAPNYSSTPPCGRTKKSLPGRSISGGVGFNSDLSLSRPPSPPFISHPMTLQQEVVMNIKSRRHFNQSDQETGEGNYTAATSALLHPSSLETLSKSPFKSFTHVEAGTENAIPTMWSSMNALNPHFVTLVPASQNCNLHPCHDPSQLYQPSPSPATGAANSAIMLGSTQGSGGYFLSLSFNSKVSAAIGDSSGTDSGMPLTPRFISEEMPFIDDNLAATDEGLFSKAVDVARIDFMSSSVAAASSLAHKCATASRLSLFSHDNVIDVDERGADYISQGSSGTLEITNEDRPKSKDRMVGMEHLAEFKDFGASLSTNLQNLSFR